jgi:hypothetical protein
MGPAEEETVNDIARVRRAWIEGGSAFFAPLWREKFKAVDPRKFMDAQERKRFDALDDVFTIYRGVALGWGHDGLSWTLRRDVAERFAELCATRNDRKAIVLERRVRKCDLFALIHNEELNEEEIILR